MPRFLIDINLPHRFSLWHGPEFLYQIDRDRTERDTGIWEYARQQDLVIVTKDADFQSRILFRQPPPRVVHVRLGNMRMREFHRIISTVWPEVCALVETHKLVLLYPSHIEAIR